VEKASHAIEEGFTTLDLRGVHMAPRDGHAEGGAGLAVGAGGGGEPAEAYPALVAVALGDVEGDGAEGAPELLAEIAVALPDASDDWAQDPDGLDGDLECVERSA